MRLRSSALLLPLLLTLACDADVFPNQDDDIDEPCQPPGDGVPESYSISLVGFPEIEGNVLIGDEDLQFSGPCLLDAMDFAGGQLTLSLSCDHPAPSVPEGASVTIVTTAAGVPEGVAVGDSLTFEASVTLLAHTGGDASGPIFRALENAGPETYELSDADGRLVFGATVNNLSANLEPVVVTSAYNCPDWAPCSEASVGDIAAHVRASGDVEIDVHVGEVGVVESGELAWDLSLFQAVMTDDCHGTERGGFSVVRRPE